MNIRPGLEGQKVVVTGASGFIGRHLVGELAKSGCEIISVFSGDQPLDHCRHVNADLCESASVIGWSYSADAVIHLAAQSGGIQSQNRSDLIVSNVTMTANALRIAETSGASTFLLASSGVVYDPPITAVPQGEESPVIGPTSRWKTDYAWSKLTNEVQCSSWADKTGRRLIIARLATVFGPGGNFDERTSSVIHALIRRAIDTPPEEPLEVWGDGSPVRTFVHVTDAARAFAFLLGTKSSGVFNVSTTEQASISDVANMILAALDRTQDHVLYRPEMPDGPDRVLDGSKLRSLRFEPLIDLYSGIAATVAQLTGSALIR